MMILLQFFGEYCGASMKFNMASRCLPSRPAASAESPAAKRYPNLPVRLYSLSDCIQNTQLRCSV
jgi:hypothetical protein